MKAFRIISTALMFCMIGLVLPLFASTADAGVYQLPGAAGSTTQPDDGRASPLD